MKRNLLLISGLLLVNNILFAQAPNFTSSYHPNPGSTAYEQFAYSSGVSLGTPGTSQTWNYTSLNDSGSVITGGYVAASSTPSYWYSIFPSANLADGSNAFGYLYTNAGSNSWVILGFAGTSSGDTLRYTTPETILEYPFTYQTNFANTFAANSSTTSNGGTETDTRTGTDTFNADGYGTIELPGGSNYVFSNVLRAVLIQNYTDVFDEDGFYDTIYERVYTVDYFWASNSTQPLLSISTLTETEDGFSESGTSVEFYPNTNTGINNVSSIIENLNVFPNPSYTQSTVSLNLKETSSIKVYVTNILGQQVRTITTEQAVTAGDHNYSFETGDLAKGIYMVTVEVNGSIAGVRKLEVE